MKALVALACLFFVMCCLASALIVIWRKQKETFTEVDEGNSPTPSLTINRTSPNEVIIPDQNTEPAVAPGTPFINIDIDGITYNMIFLQSTNRIWCKETPTGVKLIKVPR